MPSVAGKQVPLAAEVTCIPGMLNSQGTKASKGAGSMALTDIQQSMDPPW